MQLNVNSTSTIVEKRGIGSKSVDTSFYILLPVCGSLYVRYYSVTLFCVQNNCEPASAAGYIFDRYFSV